MERRVLLLGGLALSVLAPAAGHASSQHLMFEAIEGGRLDLAEFRGGPVLVVNTASRCGFTHQYDGLQALQDAYGAEGLKVVGVPSDSFRQELDSAEAVREFCEVNFGITFPMTTPVPVTGARAHPFYRWAADQGVVPKWNFHKILLDGDGQIAAEFSTRTPPDSPEISSAIEALLPRT